MTVKVTAYKTGYTTAVKTSAATAAVVKNGLTCQNIARLWYEKESSQRG